MFEYMPLVNSVYLKSEVRPQVLSGALCPGEDQVTLTFLIESDLLGQSLQNFTFPVARETGQNGFERVIINNSN